jgi:tetratricopeptide (TPR) repeat protein
MTISRDLGDEDLKFEALHHRWGFVYFMGQTEKMLECTAEGLQRYDRDRHHKFSYVFAGHDPGVCAHCVRAMALAIAGRTNSVRPTLDAGLALANSLQHPLTLAFFQSVAGFTAHMVRDSDGCREFAEQLIQVSARYEFPATRAIGSFMLAAARAQQGDIVPALKQMEPCFEATLAYGFLGMLPGVIMAEALAGAGRNQEALALIARLLDESMRPEVGSFVSELWRIRGELLLRQSAANAPQAESFLATALRIATAQGAPVFQLRAGIALARLLAEAGRRDEAKIAIDRASVNSLTEWNGPEIAVAAQLRSALS